MLFTCIHLINIKEINCNCVTKKRDRDQDRWRHTDSECRIIVKHLKASLSFSYFPKMTQTGWLSPCSEDSLSGGDVSPSSSTSCPLPCGILAPGCCKQAADPGLFFLSFLTATGLCLFQHSCVPLSPLVAGNNSMHTQVHQRNCHWLHYKDMTEFVRVMHYHLVRKFWIAVLEVCILVILTAQVPKRAQLQMLP